MARFIVRYILVPNVRDHRHRTAGATSAERSDQALGVPAGRCSVIAWFGYFGLIPCSLDRDELPLSVEFQGYLSDPKHSVLLESILESGISLEMGNYLLSRCFAG